MKIELDLATITDSWGTSLEEIIADEVRSVVRKMVRAEIKRGSAEMNKNVKAVVGAAMTEIGKVRVADIIKSVIAEDKKAA